MPVSLSAVSPPLSSSAIALRLLHRKPDAAAPVRGAAPSAAVGHMNDEEKVDNSFRLSARNDFALAEKLFQMTYETSAKLALALEARGQAMAQAVPTGLADLSPEDAAFVASFGADSVISQPDLELDQVSFDQLVGGFMRRDFAGQPGFDAAQAAGKVQIRRASEVPEFNFAHRSFALFRDGNMIGGAGRGALFNQALYDQVAATGLQQGFGSVMGQGFYVTWPGPNAA